MRTPDDDDAEMDDEMTRLCADRTAEGAPAGSVPGADSDNDELERVLCEMRELGRWPAPKPSVELESLLTKGLPNLRRRTFRRNLVVGAAVVGAMTVGVTDIAAANDRLPGGSHGVVAGVINNLTPFHVHDRREHAVIPSRPMRVPGSEPHLAPMHPAPRPADLDDRSTPGASRSSAAAEPRESDDHPPGTAPTTSRETGAEWGTPSSTSWGSPDTERSDDRHRPSPSPTPTYRERDH